MRYIRGHVFFMLTKILTCCSPGSKAAPAVVYGQANAPANVPDFVVKYAPLVYLYPEEKYLPSDLQAQIDNTTPKNKLAALSPEVPPLTLDNLAQLNLVGTSNGTDICLTSNVDITTNPEWLYGIIPDANGKTAGISSCVIVVADKGNGTVDAFYFYFYAYNWGGTVAVINKNLGNHVGDWEHNLVRFVNGEPQYVYYSQHSAGQTFQYSVVEKDVSGLRPISYAGNGSHANYAVTGVRNHDNPDLILGTPGLLNDYTGRGPLWDPAQSALWYSWVPPISNTLDGAAAPGPAPAEDYATLGTFTPYDELTPTDYLYFQGRWGDYQYPDSDPRQSKIQIFSFSAYKFVTGPNGPAFKNLGRKDPWEASHGRVLGSLDGII